MSTITPPQWAPAFKQMELEAAWDRAKMLEEERDTALLRAAECKKGADRMVDRSLAYSRGIRSILQKYGPAAKAASILAELQQLYENPLGE